MATWKRQGWNPVLHVLETPDGTGYVQQREAGNVYYRIDYAGAGSERGNGMPTIVAAKAVVEKGLKAASARKGLGCSCSSGLSGTTDFQVRTGMKVQAIGVTGRRLVEGRTYTLRIRSKPDWRGVPIVDFLGRRGQAVAAFDESTVILWLRTGMAGDHNGLIIK
jgi:hypothetical protein